MREQGLRTKERLNRHYPVKDVEWNVAFIVAFCVAAAGVLTLVALIVKALWHWFK